MANSQRVTFTLDRQTVERINRAAVRLGISRSGVVREAVAEYVARANRLSEVERARMLATFDELVARIPKGPSTEADAEIAALREARRHGGHRFRAEC